MKTSSLIFILHKQGRSDEPENKKSGGGSSVVTDYVVDAMHSRSSRHGINERGFHYH
ncbi:hypothetical protein Ga0123461_0831 [Mariprofundus aestuarium]|uniref:Uncharacterized protein n=1 Tax=Mariprofundus aestuarium TaxID=1921086 RepID=A0A2K8L0B5_MARES|nr:hypothetical protein Ga0123461_0831 [Mariprofundus aestuarium]